MTEIVPAILAAAAGGTSGYTLKIATGLVIDPSVNELVKVIAGASVTVIMGWIAYRSLNRKLDDVNKKTAVIEGHVNSDKAKADGEILALQQEVRILRDTLSEKKETAALLAQSAASAPPPAHRQSNDEPSKYP